MTIFIVSTTLNNLNYNTFIKMDKTCHCWFSFFLTYQKYTFPLPSFTSYHTTLNFIFNSPVSVLNDSTLTRGKTKQKAKQNKTKTQRIQGHSAVKEFHDFRFPFFLLRLAQDLPYTLDCS